MSQDTPGPFLDERTGDLAVQASLLQMAQEQAAIRAALAGRVRGTDAMEDRTAIIEPFEGRHVLEGDEVTGRPAARQSPRPRA